MKDEFISPLSDFVFVRVFGEQKNIDNTKAFLKTFLDIPEDKYDKLTVKSPVLRRIFKQGKEVVLDLKLRTKSGKIIHIEIQVQKKHNMRNRILYYSTRLVTGQLGRGEDYNKLRQVISIVICDHELLEEEDSYINVYELKNGRNRSFTNMMKIIIIELPKVPRIEDGELWPWLSFLKCKKKEDYEMLKSRYPALAKTINCASGMSFTEQWRDIQFHKKLWKIDEKNLLLQARMDGRDEGLIEGMAESKVEIARKMKSAGMSFTEIKKYTGLSLGEIESL